MRKLLLCLIALTIASSVCIHTEPVSQKPTTDKRITAVPIPGITRYNFPRIQVLRSLYPLKKMLACGAVGLPGELKIVLNNFILREELSVALPSDVRQSLSDEYNRLIAEPKGRSHPGYSALTDGSIDILFVWRKPKESDIEYATKRGVEFDVCPVMLDAFVVLVSPKNPVKEMTVDQVSALYGREISSWHEFGGYPQCIRDRLYVDGALRGYTGAEEMADEMFGPSNHWLPPQSPEGMNERKVFFSTLYFESIKGLELTAIGFVKEAAILAVNGVAPTKQHVKDGTYPLTAPVYIAIRKNMDPQSSAVILRDWLLSDKGQKLIEDCGYVPLRWKP